MKGKAILKVRDLKKFFDVRGSLLETLVSRKREYLKAVDGISFDIIDGEIFGLVGESGCGKTTTGKLLMNLIKPTSGKVYFEDYDLYSIKDKIKLNYLHRKMQIIFQEPYEYLSPWLTVQETLAEPLRIHEMVKNKVEELNRIKEIMETVGLTPIERILPKYSFELSGGQRQRVVIARSLLLQPKFVVADEPVSMLDVSIRLGILNLILDLKDKYSLTCLYITHNIAVARYMCDRIAVMYLGKIVEQGPAETITQKPLHPYTKALISAVPVADPKISYSQPPIKGHIQSAINLPPGCRFHPRCHYAQDVCKRKEPELLEVGKNHLAACHLIEDI